MAPLQSRILAGLLSKQAAEGDERTFELLKCLATIEVSREYSTSRIEDRTGGTVLKIETLRFCRVCRGHFASACPQPPKDPLIGLVVFADF